MKLRGKWIIVAGMAVLVIVLGIIVLAFMPREDPREAEARRLIAELRRDPPGRIRQWLIDLDLIEPAPTRDAWDIMEDLAKLGPPAVPVLISGLGDRNPSVRQHSAEAIALIGPAAHEATPHLVAALEDAEWRVRFAAADALRLLGRRDVVVPFLVQTLESKQPLERCLAACGLGLFDPPAKEAVPALREALKDEAGGVRHAAQMSLKKIQAVPATQKGVDAQAKRIMDAVERAESLRGPMESYDYDAVAKRLRDVVGKITDPVVLEKVFYICERRLRQMPRSQGDLRAGSHYWLAQEAIVLRIGRLPGTRSAKILVHLLRDETLSWDGGGALTIGGAITYRGKDCLPYLLEIPETHEQKRFASELVEYIRKGKVFGP